MATYSNEFNEAFDRLATHEGWGENGDRYDSKDKGGRHKWGISQRANPDLNFDTLTKDDAKSIFKKSTGMLLVLMNCPRVFGQQHSMLR